jgi:hypothetical protein
LTPRGGPGHARLAVLLLAVLAVLCAGARPSSYASAAGGNFYLQTPGLVTTFAGHSGQYNWEDGRPEVAKFRYPFGVAVNAAGVVFVADHANVAVRKIALDGTVSTFSGANQGCYYGPNEPGEVAAFCRPTGIAVNATGHVFVADMLNHRILAISPDDVVSVLAGAFTPAGGYQDGAASAALFNGPGAVAVGADGVLYIADRGNCCIRKIENGVVSTFAGSARDNGCYLKNGPAKEAAFRGLTGVAVDSDGAVYVAEPDHNIVRRIAGGDVTIFAGTTERGHRDGSATTAMFDAPYGLAFDPHGVLHVTDVGTHCIRTIQRDGTTGTLAGTCGSAGFADGALRRAKFAVPVGMAFHSSGTLYIAEMGAHRIRAIFASPVPDERNVTFAEARHH